MHKAVIGVTIALVLTACAAPHPPQPAPSPKAAHFEIVTTGWEKECFNRFTLPQCQVYGVFLNRGAIGNTLVTFWGLPDEKEVSRSGFCGHGSVPPPGKSPCQIITTAVPPQPLCQTIIPRTPAGDWVRVTCLVAPH